MDLACASSFCAPETYASGKCQLIGQAGEGEPCTSVDLNFQECAPGLYCNKRYQDKTGTCIRPFSQGGEASCSLSVQCQEGLVCSYSTCSSFPTQCVHDGECGTGVCNCAGQCVTRPTPNILPDPCLDTWLVSTGDQWPSLLTTDRTWSTRAVWSTCSECTVATASHSTTSLLCARLKSPRTSVVLSTVLRSELVARPIRRFCLTAAHKRSSGSTCHLKSNRT